MDLWRSCLSILLVVLLPGGCGASTPMARGRVMTVAVPSTAPVAARPTTCEVPEWVRPPGLDAAPQSVPAAVVTRACEELGARARRLARAPVPTSWRAAHEEVLEARAELGEDAEDEGLVDPLEQIEALRDSGRCVVAGAGAWAIEALAESFDEDETYVLRARVVHVDDDGTMRPSAPFELRTGGEWTPGPVLRPVFDFDADGRVEASLQVWDAGEHTRLFTATGEGVREIALPLTVGVAHWIDFDADGRPDLLADRLYTESECYEWSTVWGMPSLLLHSGPGLTFSADDTVARRYAAEVCPCAPTRLLAPARHGVDEPLFSGDTRVRIACARLWGVSPSAIELRLASEIAELSDAQRHEGDVCAASLETLSAFAETDPPLRLDHGEGDAFLLPNEWQSRSRAR